MFRQVLLAVLAIFLISSIQSKKIPSPEEIKAELIGAGISDAASAGIIKIGDKYKPQFVEAQAQGNRETTKKLFQEVKTEVGNYIKTQSEADQKVYAVYINKKTAEFEKENP